MGIWFDGLFLGVLLIAMPLFDFYLRKTKDTRTPRVGVAKYRLTILTAIFLLGLLFLAWQTNDRTLGDLGLGYPNKKGFIGIGLACVLSLIFILMSFMPVKNPEKEWQKIDKEHDEFNLKSTSEFVEFILFAIIIGFAWEVLYRGALLYYFTPYIGMPFTVLLAAAIYTFDPGAKTWKGYVATFIVAVALLLLFVLSESLWGPIILHIAVPLIGLLAHYRMEKHLKAKAD